MARKNHGRTRRGTIGALSGAALLLASSACASPPHPNAEGDLILKFGDSFSATHPIGAGGVTPFIDTLQERGDDLGLDVEYFASGQMGKQRDMAALLRSGVIQLGAVSPAYVGTELPLSNVGDLPGLISDACTGADAVLATMQEGGTLFEEELEPRGIRPLWVAVVPHYEAMTAGLPVQDPSDLDGEILRSTGGVADRVVDEVGAAGVSMPLGDLYEAISRKTVAGTLASPASIGSYKLGEVLHYSTEDARLGAFTVTFSISEDVWDMLDDDQRDLLREAGEAAQDGACKAIEEEQAQALKEMRQQGVRIHEITDGERAAWDELAEPVRENWVSDLESTGRPASEVLTEFETALEETRR
ncbi:TRAP transporter substrate-binding protein DctP [Nocardioides sp. JQ2195]|uniref:TRAP transporter substrate-binding protein n=1 Tax=Nocardioides sp. JQ2195 TaxID=2592334 RepID=UPI00143E279F|nr:TRAP transporter substrate-binding protein DctP [Nocardioides sp. JQ2195]QIX25303.1 TRAP transporter substrate-binding protein DctP [Nocardioides sp. JQ2195]